MSNIVKGNKIGVGGLHARMAAKEMLQQQAPTSDPKSMPHRLAIIADFSGSMSEYADRSATITKSKLELLKDAIQDFSIKSDETTTAIAIESFPDGFRVDLTTDKQSIWLRMFGATTLGDTPMGRGLSNGLEFHSPSRAMLISDGEATDGDESYRQAEIYRKREIPIDCVHIGSSRGGEERLEKIAEMTGGIYIKFTDVSSFSQSFHYLLPESRDQIAGMLPEQRSNLLGCDESK